jgi:transposase-like protein
MSRKPRVAQSPQEKWQIIHEGIKSGNVSETCRRHRIVPNLFYRPRLDGDRRDVWWATLS